MIFVLMYAVVLIYMSFKRFPRREKLQANFTLDNIFRVSVDERKERGIRLSLLEGCSLKNSVILSKIFGEEISQKDNEISITLLSKVFTRLVEELEEN